MIDRRKRREHGQSLVLFTLFLVVLLGMAGLAIDVSSAYAASQMQRAVADGAALAGAQDLKQTGTRTVSDTDRTHARAHALQVLGDQLHATSTPCDTSTDISGCALPGTPFVVSIKTPAPSCRDGGCSVDAYHSVQVTITNPNFELGFSRIFGINQYNVARTSVAGMGFSARYAIITLRPGCPNPRQPIDPCVDDINENGTNTLLNVVSGDVGVNTNVITNSGALIVLAPGYMIYHYSDGQPWNGAPNNPPGLQLNDLIPDPGYTPPSRTGGPTYARQSDGVDTSCTNAPGGADALPPGTVCYKPGIYHDKFKVLGSQIAYLTSNPTLGGAYFFDGGAQIDGQLLGGLVSNKPGVVIVVPNSQTFAANNAVKLWLNKGGSSCSSDACRATAPLDYSLNSVETPGHMILTLMVTEVPGCFDPSGFPTRTCNPSSTIKIPGNAEVFLAGVTYAPSDSVQVQGNLTSTTGTIGQLVSWWTTYGGGAQLNQEYPGGDQPGILRLDAACTAPGTPCVP